MRCLYGSGRWASGAQLHPICRSGGRCGHCHRGGARRAGRAQRGAARLREASRPAMRLLHGRHIVLGDAFSARHAGTGRAAGPRDAFGSHLPVHGICVDCCRGARSRDRHRQRVVTMDLGSAFAAAVMRQPRQEALVEGNRRMTYADWYRDIASVAGGLIEMGLKAGDHLVVVMRNRYEMATLYWACHFVGIVFTPVSWRASAEEIRFCLEDAEAAAVAFDGAAGTAVADAAVAFGIVPHRVIVAADGKGDGKPFERLLDARAVAG